MNQLVSIIVPIYNAEKFLDRCIESLVNQTYKNIEVILLNDGSNDTSLDICEKWKKKDDRIILKSSLNQGVSKTRNAGLDIATGTYISFVDSDDYVENNFIEKMLSMIIESDSDMAECTMNVRNINNDIIKRMEVSNNICDNQNTIKLDFANLNKTNDFIANKVFKKSIIGATRFSFLIVSEDYEFLTRIYENVKRKVSTNEALYNYFVYERKYDQEAFSSKEIDTINARKKVFEFYQQQGEIDLMNITAVQILSRIMSWYELATNDTKEVLYKTFKDYYHFAIKAPTSFVKKVYRILKFKIFLINPKFAIKHFGKSN